MCERVVERTPHQQVIMISNSMLLRRVTIFMIAHCSLRAGGLSIADTSLRQFAEEFVSRSTWRCRRFFASPELGALKTPGNNSSTYSVDAVKLMLEYIAGERLSVDTLAAMEADVRQHLCRLRGPLVAVPPAAPPAGPIHVESSDEEPPPVPLQDSESGIGIPGGAGSSSVVAIEASSPYANVSEWGVDVVVAQLAVRDCRIARLSKRVRELQQTVRRTRSKLESIRASGRRDCPDDIFAVEVRGSRNLTLRGTMALAIRRNLSTVSCADIGSVILSDVSRWSVARAEVRAAAALTASAKYFFAEAERRYFAPPPQTGSFPLIVHGFRSDATNSSIWQRRKLTSLELESSTLRSLLLRIATITLERLCAVTVCVLRVSEFASNGLRCAWW